MNILQAPEIDSGISYLKTGFKSIHKDNYSYTGFSGALNL